MTGDPTISSSSVVFNEFYFWWVVTIWSMVVLNIRRPRHSAPLLDLVMSAVAISSLALALLAITTVAPLLYALLCLVSIVPMVCVIGRQGGRKKGVKYWMASAVVYVMLVVLFAFAYTL